MDELIPLRQCTLGKLPTSVMRPTYDRSALTPGIVHIGVGNFHRAHQAWYLHRLMEQGLAQDWAIIGAGVRAYDASMREKLLAQDCLTTLLELDPSGRSSEVTGSMIDYLPVQDGNTALIECMANPAIRIVSMTVTESGYFTDPTTNGLALGHEDIVHDVQNPATPRTAFGSIVQALKLRRANGDSPFTCLSCDNLMGNGQVTRDRVVSLARQTDLALAEWIDAYGAFPSSMVDCIVPATGPHELAMVNRMNIGDAVPVAHENFRQWVIQDDFCAGRPEWEKVGVTFTNDVHGYETMKIRVLNAGHQILANVGELLSIPTISACMQDPQINAFFRKVETEEILPHVPAVPTVSGPEYLDLISQRFSNPEIHDTTRRVAFDGSGRHLGFVLPILRDAVAVGGAVNGLALVEAFWARMCAGTREDGTQIEPNDPKWNDLTCRANQARKEPSAWLEGWEYYGGLAKHSAFTGRFCDWLDRIWAQGSRNVLRDYLVG